MASRLFDAIIDANHRALAGDPEAGLHPGDYADELPLIALSCVDPRLNALLPQVLGVPPEQFIWLRNAGNIITGPMSSTMRSLALACAVKGGKEIVIIGHTDCQVAKTTAMQLLDRFRDLGIERHLLPDNLNEFFGIFASDRQNVLKAVECVRSSPLIGPKIPVHGLLVEIDTGKLEWLVNGYETLGTATTRFSDLVRSAGQSIDALKPIADFNLGEMKFPETKIGEIAGMIGDELSRRMHQAPSAPDAPAVEGAPSSGLPSHIPVPTGFAIGEMKFPESKIGEVAAGIGDEISRRMHRAPAGSGPQVRIVPPAGPPPKIPLPPRLKPKMHLRRPSK
jgi:carbonic anhydrase